MPVMRATNKAASESASGKIAGFIPPDPAEETAMSHPRYPFRHPPRPRPSHGRHRQLRGRLQDRFARGLRHGALHAARFAGLRDAGHEAPGMRQASGPAGAGRQPAGRRARSGHLVRARSGAGRLQHRRAGALAGFQRHLAGGRVGPSFRQPRRDPGGRRLPEPQGRARGRQAGDGARRARPRPSRPTRSRAATR